MALIAATHSLYHKESICDEPRLTVKNDQKYCKQESNSLQAFCVCVGGVFPGRTWFLNSSRPLHPSSSCLGVVSQVGEKDCRGQHLRGSP